MSNVHPAPSEEQMAALPTGVDICYQTFGDPEGDPLLLVMGLGGPMTWWSPELCQRLRKIGDAFSGFLDRQEGSEKVPTAELMELRKKFFTGGWNI